MRYTTQLAGIRKFAVLPFLVFYCCDHASQTVSILHFWHGARQWPEFE